MATTTTYYLGNAIFLTIRVFNVRFEALKRLHHTWQWDSGRSCPHPVRITEGTCIAHRQPAFWVWMRRALAWLASALRAIMPSSTSALHRVRNTCICSQGRTFEAHSAEKQEDAGPYTSRDTRPRRPTTLKRASRTRPCARARAEIP